MSLGDQIELPASCNWCPRMCGANRAAGQPGFCGASDKLRVARAALHFWEEPPISGTAGSGAVFFSGCSLRCCFCQNAHISNNEVGKDITVERLSEIFFELKEAGALNINLVTPTHFCGFIKQAMSLAKAQGFDLPFIWNTSGYETVEMIQGLRDYVDIYLDDFKYADDTLAKAYSGVSDYTSVALSALDAMVLQAGEPVMDTYRGEDRLIGGVVVRHLLLPGHLEASKAAVRLLYERYGESIMLSLMNQYTPVLSADSAAAKKYPNLLTAPTDSDYEELLDYADSLGVEDYFWQAGGAVGQSFIPEFDLTGV